MAISRRSFFGIAAAAPVAISTPLRREWPARWIVLCGNMDGLSTEQLQHLLSVWCQGYQDFSPNFNYVGFGSQFYMDIEGKAIWRHCPEFVFLRRFPRRLDHSLLKWELDENGHARLVQNS